MGFIFDRVYALRFEDPAFKGLVVKCRPLPLERLFALSNSRFGSDDAGALERLRAIWADFRPTLIEWNLCDREGEPVAHDWDAFYGSQPLELVDNMLRSWVRSQRAVPAPLPRPSEDGVRSVEAQIPMETPSESLTS